MPPFKFPQRRRVPIIVLVLLCTSVLTASFHYIHYAPTTSRPPRLVKATIAYPSLSLTHKHVLDVHAAQNALFVYERHILRRPIVKGGANIFYWLMHVLTAELQRPVEERVEWVLYFDPSVVVMDPESALDILLPPPANSEDVEASEAFKDLAFIFPHPFNPNANHTLSLSVFWLRVSATTLSLFASAIHEIHSSTSLPDGRDVSALALQRVLEREKEGSGKVVYQPRSWYGVPGNAEVERGKGKAVFGQPRPGNVFEAERELRMLLEQAEGKGGDADMGAIERDVRVWWERVVEARRGGAGGG